MRRKRWSEPLYRSHGTREKCLSSPTVRHAQCLCICLVPILVRQKIPKWEIRFSLYLIKSPRRARYQEDAGRLRGPTTAQSTNQFIPHSPWRRECNIYRNIRRPSANDAAILRKQKWHVRHRPQKLRQEKCSLNIILLFTAFVIFWWNICIFHSEREQCHFWDHYSLVLSLIFYKITIYQGRLCNSSTRQGLHRTNSPLSALWVKCGLVETRSHWIKISF